MSKYWLQQNLSDPLYLPYQVHSVCNIHCGTLDEKNNGDIFDLIKTVGNQLDFKIFPNHSFEPSAACSSSVPYLHPISKRILSTLSNIGYNPRLHSLVDIAPFLSVGVTLAVEYHLEKTTISSTSDASFCSHSNTLHRSCETNAIV